MSFLSRTCQCFYVNLLFIEKNVLLFLTVFDGLPFHFTYPDHSMVSCVVHEQYQLPPSSGGMIQVLDLISHIQKTA